MKSHFLKPWSILFLVALVGCNSNTISMSTDEFLKEGSISKDYNVQTSNFSYSTFQHLEAGQEFDELINKSKSLGSYVKLEANEEGDITYIPRANKSNSFISKNDINILKIGSNSSGNTRAYFDSVDKIIYDALGNSLQIELEGDTISSNEYSLIIGADTDIYEAMTGRKDGASIALFDLAYISDSKGVKGILFKGDKDTEYLVPKTSLLSYIDRLQGLINPISTSYSKNDDGSYVTSTYIYYYSDSVSNSHVGKRAISEETEISVKNVVGEVAFKVKFLNGNSFLYSYEIVTGYTNDFDFVKDGTRYLIHYYTNQNSSKVYEEVNKFPKFYFNKYVMSSDETKCAVLCQEINQDKTISYNYSTIAFNDAFKYGKFTSELGIFSGTSAYITFNENYYSFPTKDYSLYMYRQNDFAVLKVKDEKLGYNYLGVNSELKEFKIYATNISSLSTEHHFSYYTPGEKSLLQFIVLNTADFSSTYISNDDNKQIANMSFGLYWQKGEDKLSLKDSVGNTILEDNALLYLYTIDIGADNNFAIINGKSYNFYTMYGAQEYSTNKEEINYKAIYYLTNQFN